MEIETDFLILDGGLKILLIVPYGIETGIMCCSDSITKALLIVPYGIET